MTHQTMKKEKKRIFIMQIEDASKYNAGNKLRVRNETKIIAL